MKHILLSLVRVVWPLSITVMLVATFILYNKRKSRALIGLMLGFGLMLVSSLLNILLTAKAIFDDAGKIVSSTTPPEWMTMSVLVASMTGAILCGISLLAFSLLFQQSCNHHQTKIDVPNNSAHPSSQGSQVGR